MPGAISAHDRKLMEKTIAEARRRGNADWDLDFYDRAACRDEPLETFFPGPGNQAGPAQKICDKCPVQYDCTMMSLHNRYSLNEGIFGGMRPTARCHIAAVLGVDIYGDYRGYRESA